MRCDLGIGANHAEGSEKVSCPMTLKQRLAGGRTRPKLGLHGKNWSSSLAWSWQCLQQPNPADSRKRSATGWSNWHRRRCGGDGAGLCALGRVSRALAPGRTNHPSSLHASKLVFERYSPAKRDRWVCRWASSGSRRRKARHPVDFQRVDVAAGRQSPRRGQEFPPLDSTVMDLFPAYCRPEYAREARITFGFSPCRTAWCGTENVE